MQGIEDVEYLTSTTALELKERPRSRLVIGGVYVGAELAPPFARAGVNVPVVCRSRLLPAAEPEVGKALSRYFQNEGILLHCGIENQFVKKMDKGVALGVRQSDREEPLEAERVPVATGRKPNTKGLRLAEAGVGQTRKGGIEVDRTEE